MQRHTQKSSLGIFTLICIALGCNSPDAQVSTASGQGGSGTGGIGQSSTGMGGAGQSSSGMGGAGQSSSGMGGAGPGASTTGSGTGGGGNDGWAKPFGNPMTSAWTAGVAADGTSGEITLGGQFDYTLNFGGSDLIITPNSTSYTFDLFLARFNPDGTHLWSKSYGDTEDQVPYAMAADSTKIVLVGHYTGSPTLGTPLPMADSSGDAFVAAFTPTDGTPLWSKGFGADMASGDRDYAYDVALDPGHNVLVTGSFQNGLSIGMPVPPLTSAGDDDIFVAKFDSTGTPLWAKRFGDAAYQKGYSIASDLTGKVLVLGAFYGVIDFGNGPPLTAVGTPDLFLASFDSDSFPNWSKRFILDGWVDEPPVIAAAATGDIVIAGGYSSIIDLGKGPHVSMGYTDIFVAKFDSFGNTLWSKSFVGTDINGVYDVVIDPNDGSILLGGLFRDTINFGGGVLTATPPAGGCMVTPACNDMFLVKLDSTGTPVYSYRYGDANNDFISSLALSPAGAPVLAGTFSTQVDFGNGLTLMGGAWDIFLAQFP